VEEKRADVIAAGLGLRKVGFIFTKAVSQASRDYMLSNVELRQAAEFHAESEFKHWATAIVKLEVSEVDSAGSSIIDKAEDLPAVGTKAPEALEVVLVALALVDEVAAEVVGELDGEVVALDAPCRVREAQVHQVILRVEFLHDRCLLVFCQQLQQPLKPQARSLE
jgi:hypothetical protein